LGEVVLYGRTRRASIFKEGVTGDLGKAGESGVVGGEEEILRNKIAHVSTGQNKATLLLLGEGRENKRNLKS